MKADISWLTDGSGSNVIMCRCGNVEITPHQSDAWYAFDGVSIEGTEAHYVTCADCGRGEKIGAQG